MKRPVGIFFGIVFLASMNTTVWAAQEKKAQGLKVIDGVPVNAINIQQFIEQGKFPAPSARVKELLAEIEKDLALPGNENETLIEAALFKGDIELIKYLISLFPQDIHKKTSCCKGSLLEHLTDKEIIELLLQHNLNINEADEFGETPLFGHVIAGDLDLVKFFVEHGAAINHVNNAGLSPLCIAIEAVKTDIARFLIERGGVCSAEEFLPALKKLGYNKNKEISSELAAYPTREEIEKIEKEASADKNSNSELMLAIQTRKPFLVEHFVQKDKGQVNKLNNEGNSPLVAAIDMRSESIAKILLENGAEVNPKLSSDKERLPLLAAISYNRLPLVDLLINYGADVNRANYWGYVPLYFAALDGFNSIFERLLNAGANINAFGIGADAKPNPYAVIHGIIINKLEDPALRLLIDAGADLNILTRDEHEYTPFYLAIFMKEPEAAKMLINAGAILNRPNEVDTLWSPINTIIHMANGYYKESLYNEEAVWLNILQKMLNSKQGVNLEDADGIAVLCYAVQLGYEPAIRLLVQAGAPCGPTQQGYDPSMEKIINSIREEVAHNKKVAELGHALLTKTEEGVTSTDVPAVVANIISGYLGAEPVESEQKKKAATKKQTDKK